MTSTKRFDDERIVKIYKKHNVTPAKVFLRWLLQHDIVVIPKSANPGRIAQNIDLWSFELD